MLGSLSTAFKRMDLDHSIFSSYRVQLALRSIEINSRYTPSPKLPITPDQLESIIGVMRRKGEDPAVICAISFAFIGLFRQSNLAPPTERAFDPTRHFTRGDVTRVPGGVEVVVKWTKTIQKAQDAPTIMLPRIPGRAFCPVMALDSMILSGSAPHPTAALFTTREGRPMCLGFLKKAWVRALLALNLPPERLSLHSLRSGGATAVWHTGKVSELDLMRHGTWASTAWKGYVRGPHKDSTVLQAFKQLSK